MIKYKYIEFNVNGRFRSYTPNPRALLSIKRLSKARVMYKKGDIVAEYPPIIRKTLNERYFL